MKKIMVLLCFIFISAACVAQGYTLKGDTIKVGGHAYALYHKTKNAKPRYFISSLAGDELVVAYAGRQKVKGKDMYVITFLHDKKQGMIVKGKDIARQLITEVIKYDLVSNGTVISSDGETQFILAHPLPTGYIDAEQLSEYGCIEQCNNHFFSVQ